MALYRAGQTDPKRLHRKLHRLRDEFLNETLFSSLTRARSALLNWRSDYNDNRPHSGLGWLTPAEFAQTISRNRCLAPTLPCLA
ncbi:transposase [Sinorhizobium sp. 6-70]|nr:MULTISPECIES: transposase [unclassified Sinorhizobium]MDK1377238.1 transposase [Sinorhizobium sp. 6-70]MDK1478796.1 transposase [Sinorhizobium sp. 6-117]